MEAKKGETPQPLLERPDLLPGNHEYYEGFITLGMSRNGQNPIAISEMRAYIDIFSVEDKERFIERIQVADRIVLKHLASKKGNG